MFQRVGDQPQPEAAGLSIPNGSWPIYEPLTIELRNVTISTTAPSRWALPKAVIDYGYAYYDESKGLGKGDLVFLSDEGKMDHTVPYGQDGIIHYLVFDFGKLPAGCYRLLTRQNATYVNEGTGWVLDLERHHKAYITVPHPTATWPSATKITWHEGDRTTILGGNVVSTSDAGIYIGFREGPISTTDSTFFRPWQYHFKDGYTLSTYGFINITTDEDGDPYGYWGGYWRQSDALQRTYTRPFHPTGDALLNELYPQRNYGGNVLLEVRSHWNNRRSILQFNLASLHPNVVVESATLSLYYFDRSKNDPAGRTYFCYRLVETHWIEGTKTSAVQTGACCWNSLRYGVSDPSWIGGAYASALGASAVVPTAFGWMRWDVTRQVQRAPREALDFRSAPQMQSLITALLTKLFRR